MISLSKKLLISIAFLFSSINILALDIVNLTGSPIELSFEDPNNYRGDWGEGFFSDATFINALTKHSRMSPINQKGVTLQPKESFTLTLPNGATQLFITRKYSFGGVDRGYQKWSDEDGQMHNEDVDDDFTIVITRDTSEIGKGLKTTYYPYNPDKLVTWSKKLTFTFFSANAMQKIKATGLTLKEYMAARENDRLKFE